MPVSNRAFSLAATSFALLACVSLACGRSVNRTAATQGGVLPSESIGREDAIRLATQYAQERRQFVAGMSAVAEKSGGNWVVTFSFPYEAPGGFEVILKGRSGDYVALRLYQ
jgi:hypothetical protein